MSKLMTPWGEALDPAHVLQEYPRPQMVRESYINLNGYWDYAIRDTDARPEKFDGRILVPFSPEAELSGVGRMLLPNQTLWYRRTLTASPRAGQRLLLHFGAVDQTCEVFLNGARVGAHTGGYTAFTLDLTAGLAEENELLVAVRDGTDTNSLSRGKQKMKRGGIWYTPQSGIWQSVWCEWVPERYISGLRITPDAANGCVRIHVQSDYDGACCLHFQGRRVDGFTNRETLLHVDAPELWTPTNPKLYDFSVELGDDRVESYFALRDVAVGKDALGRPRLTLNGKPLFQSGVLDQGYWPDGLYTAPSDEAMIDDIARMKRLGFNMLRKHIKIEPMRWYYHCDRLGMLVWQDMPSGGGDYDLITVSAPLVTGHHVKDTNYRRFAREDAEGRRLYYQELEEMVCQLYNCPCIVLWVPFNEGWGQFDAKQVTLLLRRLDPTRLIDHASGWHDQHVSDVKSMHVYVRHYRFAPDKEGRAVVLSEFGGYNLTVADHVWGKNNVGYRGFRTQQALTQAVKELYETQIAPAAQKGLSACVYTQLSDVEDEVNGFVTYDRRVEKMDAEVVAALNARLTGEET